jgi:branched-chain amino acid transport system substrate-binding protein
MLHTSGGIRRENDRNRRAGLGGGAGRGRRFGLGALVLAGCVLAVAACGGSSKPATASTPAAPKPTYTIGVITDLSGALAASNKNLPFAVKAGAVTAAAEGYNLKYVIVDGESTPAGELTAAQRLVTQDHALAVIAISDLTFAAAPYLAAQGIPVIGGAVDSTEWTTDRNMFSVFGYPDYSKVETTAGAFYKQVGATNIGAIGYGGVPSATETAKATAISTEVAGLKAGYLNTTFQLGSTDVGPIVLGMKNAGIDGLAVAVQENTGFAIIKALRQQGVALKAPVLSIGYGDALLSSGPAAIQDAQNVYFTLGWEPVEMHTVATEKFVSALKSAGFAKEPGLPEYLAYTSMDAIVVGLKGAGANPTHASLINALLQVRDYGAAGLLGGHTIGFAMDQRGLAGPGADNCLWYTLFKGNTFTLVSGADPVCGTVIPGKSAA